MAYKFRRHVEHLIANLRGIPENYEGEAPKTTREIGDVLDRVVNRYKIGTESLEDKIRDSWPQIVGAANASSCHPSRIEHDRTLIISVSNPTIRQELQFNKSLLLKNLHKIEGTRKIRTLVFKAG